MEPRKVLIDIGAYQGHTIQRFYQEVQKAFSWKIYAFEPHPESYKKLIEVFGKLPNVNFFNAAVTGKDSPTREFFIGRINNGEGSTLLRGKTTGNVDYTKSIQVRAIKLSNFVKTELLATDYVILKMNIEGGEYELMQNILDEDLMSRFSQIYILLHKAKLNPADEKKYSALERRFFQKASEQNVEAFLLENNEETKLGFYHNFFRPNLKGTKMKVAHFAEFGPNRSGLYGSTRDLIMGERSVGIDSVLVDVQVKKGKVTNRPNLKDGDLKIVSPVWAREADILVRHSIIQPELEARRIPIVMAIHGRPESTFLLEHRRIMSIFTQSLNCAEHNRYSAYFIFWKEYMFHLSKVVPKEKLFYVPAMVDLDKFSPMGNYHKFKGEPNLMVIDMWRQDVTPYNVIMAAARFKDKYCPTAKIHILGAAPKKSSMKALLKTLKDEIGEVYPLVENTPNCYRGADIVITPHNIATRVVRESLACGTPIVAGSGSPYTPFTANPRDADAYADAINECWNYIKSTPKIEVTGEARRMAEDNFDPVVSGEAAKKIYKKVLKDAKGQWVEQDGFQRRKYSKYDDYLAHQKTKLDIGIGDLKEYDEIYHKELRGRLRKDSFVRKGANALCLGARSGAEVRAFRDLGCFAFGIDINPGRNNKYVVTGDFHELEYHPDSIDIIFINCIDHVYRIRRFLREIKKVLKKGGHLIFEVQKPRKENKDNWACLRWKDYDDLLAIFEEFNFKVVKIKVIDGIAFQTHICMQQMDDL